MVGQAKCTHMSLLCSSLRFPYTDLTCAGGYPSSTTVQAAALPGVTTCKCLVLRRENTEGEYSGLEHEVVDGVVESLKVRVSILGRVMFACVRVCVCVWWWGVGWVYEFLLSKRGSGLVR